MIDSLKITLTKDVERPIRSTDGSAGIDFFIPRGFDVGYIAPSAAVLIPSGVHVKVPKDHALIAFNKSGVCTKKGLVIGACVIDSDYQGEVHLHLINVTAEGVYVYPNEKIAQFLLVPVVHCSIEEVGSIEQLYGAEQSERGACGFGSTDQDKDLIAKLNGGN